MTDKIDCRDGRSEMMSICKCADPQDCVHWDDCKRHGWLTRHIKPGYGKWYHCARPPDEKTTTEN